MASEGNRNYGRAGGRLTAPPPPDIRDCEGCPTCQLSRVIDAKIEQFRYVEVREEAEAGIDLLEFHANWGV